MQNLIITKLADLHAGDRILSWDGRPYRPARVVAQRLGHIGAGSVQGVRLVNPHPTSDVEHVLYPSQMDGRRLEVERP
ncbi:hypothetical protein LJR042_003897 [Microbacterium maritypicum]|uniref:hypothetical protein n=1 Tax=Microbacterium TaxID=33882 RepID=UPI000DAF6905|nr:MAG: hypothetical protein DI630_27535 [Gordonia sp. (in: high G+C Gram-positive bacteria)]